MMNRSREGRALWVLACAVLVSGYTAIEHRYEHAISRSIERTEELQRETGLNDVAIERGASLKRAERQVRGDLQHLATDNSMPKLTAMFLYNLESDAHALGVSVTSVELQQRLANEKTTVGLEDLTSVPMIVRLKGAFPRLIRFVQELSLRRLLVRVDNTDLTAIPANAGSRVRVALEVHLTLYELSRAAVGVQND